MSKHTYGTTNQTPEWGKHPPDDWQVVEEALPRDMGDGYTAFATKKQVAEGRAALARLREREALLTDEARKNFDWAKAERSGRKQERTRADQAAARVAELEQQAASATQACNVAVTQAMKLEEALREYEHLYSACLAFQSDDHESWRAVIHAMDAIAARRAVAHKEETQ